MGDSVPATASRTRWWSVRAEFARLRLMAVVIPALYLLVAEVVRRALWPSFWSSPIAAVVLYVTTGIAVVAFAVTVFSLIERYEALREQQAHRIESLHRLASTASEHLDIESVISAGLDDVLLAVAADAGVVCRVYPEEWEHSALCTRGLSPNLQREIQRAKLADDPVANRVATTGRPVEFREVFDDPRVREAAAREDIQDGMTVPLVAAGAVNGVIAVAYRRPHRFTVGEREFLISAGRHLGLALRNVALYEQTVRQNSELGALLSVSRAIARAQTTDEIAQAVLPEMIEAAGCEAAEFWTVDEGGGLSLVHRGRSPRDTVTDRAEVEAPFELVERAAVSTNTQFQLPNGTLEPPGRADVAPAVDRWAAIPVQYGSRVLGVLAAGSSSVDRLRTAPEIRLLTGIAELMGPALDNSRLRVQLQNEAALEERERISREMHDGLAQVLGYVNTQALAVRKLLADGLYERAQAEVERLQTAAREVYADVREGILALHESSAQGPGAVAAIEAYVGHFRELFGIDVDVTVTEEARAAVLTPAVDLQLVRILQEALSNVRRHAGASHVEVRCWVDRGCLGAEVRDNGSGFNADMPTLGSRTHFGLRTMTERARAVGGAFDVSSTPGVGTCVQVRVPVDAR